MRCGPTMACGHAPPRPRCGRRALPAPGRSGRAVLTADSEAAHAEQLSTAPPGTEQSPGRARSGNAERPSTEPPGAERSPLPSAARPGVARPCMARWARRTAERGAQPSAAHSRARRTAERGAQPSAAHSRARRTAERGAQPSAAHSRARRTAERGGPALRAWPPRVVQPCQRSTAPRPPAGPWSPSGTTSTSVSATAADRISASSARAGSGVLTPMARAWERCTAT